MDEAPPRWLPVRAPAAVATGLLVTYAIALYGSLGGLPYQPAHGLHLFFSEQYAADFFELLSQRSSGGFPLTSHPPLAYQLVALTSHLPLAGVERAYALWTVGAALLLVSGAVLLAAELDRRAAAVAALLFSTQPVVFLAMYPYGQLPFLLGVGLALWGAAATAAGALSVPRLSAYALLTAAALTAHPAALAVSVAGAGLSALNAQEGRWRALAVLAVGVSLAGWALQPFIELARGHQMRAIEGPHPIAPSGPVALGVLAALAALGMLGCLAGGEPRTSRVRPLGLALVALTGLTLAGQRWGLPEDKLGMLAALSGSLLCALLAARGPPAAVGLASLLALGQLVATSAGLGRPAESTVRKHRGPLAEVIRVLSAPGAERHRYLTVGIGNERHELSRRARAATLGEGAPWLKRGPLAQTRFASVDELPLEQPEAMAALVQILSQAEQHHLRWVISADARLEPVLQEKGFAMRSAFKGMLILWEKDGVPAIPATEARHERHLAFSVLPLCFTWLGGAAALLLLLARRRPSAGSLSPRAPSTPRTA